MLTLKNEGAIIIIIIYIWCIFGISHVIIAQHSSTTSPKKVYVTTQERQKGAYVCSVVKRKTIKVGERAKHSSSACFIYLTLQEHLTHSQNR